MAARIISISHILSQLGFFAKGKIYLVTFLPWAATVDFITKLSYYIIMIY